MLPKNNFKFPFCLFIWGFTSLSTLQVMSRRVVGRAEATSTYNSLGFCTVNCRPSASNYQLSHWRPWWERKPRVRGGRRECYHSATVAPVSFLSPSEKKPLKSYLYLKACPLIAFALIFSLCDTDLSSNLGHTSLYFSRELQTNRFVYFWLIHFMSCVGPPLHDIQLD